VLVTGTPAPVAVSRPGGGSAFDNWAIGGIVAAIVAGALWMHSGMTIRSFGRRTPSEIEIDT
jgi:hypothetical protein